MELFVLDDGWFGARSNDFAGLGDWVVNTDRLANGITGLAERMEQTGMKFGLWFEPEMVNKDSDLYRSHPDRYFTGSRQSQYPWQEPVCAGFLQKRSGGLNF